MALCRWTLAYDDTDPRFAHLDALLRGLVRPGKQSPVPQLLAALALDGFDLRLGHLAPGTAHGSSTPVSRTEAMRDEMGAIDLATIVAAQQHLAAQATEWEFD